MEDNVLEEFLHTVAITVSSDKYKCFSCSYLNNSWTALAEYCDYNIINQIKSATSSVLVEKE